MESIFETLVREGYTFNSQLQGETRKHGSAYSKLSSFIGGFESKIIEIFQ